MSFRNNYYGSDDIDPKSYLREQYHEAQRALNSALSEVKNKAQKDYLDQKGVTQMIEDAKKVFEKITGNHLDMQYV